MDCEGCVVEYARPCSSRTGDCICPTLGKVRTRKKFRLLPNKNLIFRLLNLNRVLLWGSVFRGEGSGNEDNFLNSGRCAGPGFQAGKVPPHSPPTSRPVQPGMHCFSGHRVFHGTARQTAEKSNVFLWCLGSDSSGISLLASNAVSGAPLLRARGGLGPNFADDRLAERDELVSAERVHDQLLCDGSSGVPLMRAGGTGDSS